MKITKKQIETLCKKLKCNLDSYSYLASGNHNDIYLIKGSHKNYIIKIGEDSNRLFTEFKTIKNLKKSLGPKVYLFDKSKTILPKAFFVQEFLVGRHPSKKVGDIFVIAMAKWYKRLHSIKSAKIDPKERKIFSSLTYWSNRYVEKYEKNKKQVNKNLIKEINNFFGEINEICKKYNSLFKSRKNFSLNQNDPSEDNIFIADEKIKIIDWEFSGYGLYERDLILFLERYKLSKKQESLFFKYYGKNKSELIKRLKILSIILSCEDINYLLDRLSMISKGKISKRKQSSKKRPLVEKLKKILNQSNKNLRELKWRG
jgi:thiamine kinase-like enzyme